jgi:hypothetical protein
MLGLPRDAAAWLFELDIELPEGGHDDPPTAETVNGLGTERP